MPLPEGIVARIGAAGATPAEGRYGDTPVERTLIEAGQEEAVKGTRQVFQMAMRQRFSDAVEEITGRKVVAFMSQVHLAPDLAAEIFVFEPTATDAAAGDGNAAQVA